MKAYLCKECKFNNNGWCNKYECNGSKRTEICHKYKDEVSYEQIDIEMRLYCREHDETCDRKCNACIIKYILNNYNVERKIKRV